MKPSGAYHWRQKECRSLLPGRPCALMRTQETVRETKSGSLLWASVWYTTYPTPTITRSKMGIPVVALIGCLCRSGCPLFHSLTHCFQWHSIATSLLCLYTKANVCWGVTTTNCGRCKLYFTLFVMWTTCRQYERLWHRNRLGRVNWAGHGVTRWIGRRLSFTLPCP